jgi:hypothetical protein
MKKILITSFISLLAYASYCQSSSFKYSELTEYQRLIIESNIKLGTRLGLDENMLTTLYRSGKIGEANLLVYNKGKALSPIQKYKLMPEAEELDEKLDKVKIEKDCREEAEQSKSKSDFNNILVATATFYKEWVVKSVFEKTADYENRMKNELEEMNSFISDMINSYRMSKLVFTALEYDADKERMYMKFKNGNGDIWFGYADNINAELAKEIKKNGIPYDNLITSITNGDQIPVLFNYYNLVPAKIYGFKWNSEYKITITQYPFGLNNGSKLLTRENIGINTKTFRSYNLEDLRSNVIAQETKEENNLKQQRQYDRIMDSVQNEFIRVKEYKYDGNSSRKLASKIDSLIRIYPKEEKLLKAKRDLITFNESMHDFLMNAAQTDESRSSGKDYKIELELLQRTYKYYKLANEFKADAIAEAKANEVKERIDLLSKKEKQQKAVNTLKTLLK